MSKDEGLSVRTWSGKHVGSRERRRHRCAVGSANRGAIGPKIAKSGDQLGLDTYQIWKIPAQSDTRKALARATMGSDF